MGTVMRRGLRRRLLPLLTTALVVATAGTASVAAAPTSAAPTAAGAPTTTPATPTATPATPATVPAGPAAGRVLSSSAIARADLPPGAASGQRVTYVTRDQNNRMALSTGVFYVPRGNVPAGGWRIFSWAHGTTGIADECAPSRTRRGDGVESPVIDALKRGYAVTATDYAGLGSAGESEYLGGRAAAHSVIDMIRAARARDHSLGTEWVSAGHSQGGHAALFAGHEAPGYAPELRLREILALAPASGIEGVLTKSFTPDVPSLGRINTVSALYLYILAGLDHARPDLHVTDHLTSDGKRFLDLARSECNGEVSQALRSVAPGSLLGSALGGGQFAAALADYTRVPTGGYTVPIRIDHGLLDPVVPFGLTAALVRSMRSAGTDVDLHTHIRADHTEIVADSLDEVMDTAATAFGRD
ncbi:lipase family protein [Gordonia sp. DT219]|uniref:lipase family protein n=1 Tax=Gordonia sp. DT219 TaxID=3416658 RepID=UPI003CF15802